MARGDDDDRAGAKDGGARERLARVEERIERAGEDIVDLRRSRHDHGNAITVVVGRVDALEASMSRTADVADVAARSARDAERDLAALKEAWEAASRRNTLRLTLAVSAVVAAVQVIARLWPAA